MAVALLAPPTQPPEVDPDLDLIRPLIVGLTDDEIAELYGLEEAMAHELSPTYSFQAGIPQLGRLPSK